MKYKKYVAFLAVLSVTTMLANDIVYARTAKQQNVVSVQEKKEQTEQKKGIDTNSDTNETILCAGVAQVLNISFDNMKTVTIEETATAKASSTKEAVQQNYWGYTNLGIAHVDNHLNIREEPSESGKLVGKLSKNAACEILSVEDGWAHIKSGKVEGYCSTDYLYTGQEAINKAKEVASLIAVVDTETLKVREEPNTAPKYVPNPNAL